MTHFNQNIQEDTSEADRSPCFRQAIQTLPTKPQRIFAKLVSTRRRRRGDASPAILRVFATDSGVKSKGEWKGE
jgi:hypothetical protein